MFGHKRSTAIKQRAKLMGRMYDQFVERYSNSGDEHRWPRTHNLGSSSRAPATIVE
jgi:hypothetical protein